MTGGDGSPHHPVPQYADALHLGLEDVTWLEVLGRYPREADAVRRAGRDQGAGQQRHADGEPDDQLLNRIDHVPRVAVLFRFAIDPQGDAQVLYVRDLIGRHHPGPDGRRRIEALAFEELAPPPVLDVPGADVVDDGVAEYVAHRVAGGDVSASFADEDAQFHLPIDLVTDGGVDTDVVVGSSDRGLRLGEDGWRLDVLAPGARTLGSVLLVIAANRQHIAFRRIQRSQKSQALQLAHHGP